MTSMPALRNGVLVEEVEEETPIASQLKSINPYPLLNLLRKLKTPMTLKFTC